jgi:hypothetical protein
MDGQVVESTLGRRCERMVEQRGAFDAPRARECQPSGSWYRCRSPRRAANACRYPRPASINGTVDGAMMRDGGGDGIVEEG